MKYDIYFHGGCFDGIASAVVIQYFLEKKGRTIANLKQVTYPVNQRAWKAMRFENPTAIVDTLYHPKATIWFDHHPTAFLDKRWQKNFSADDFRKLDTTSPSCTGLIVQHLTNTLHIPLPKRFHQLAHWLDIADGDITAYYLSPKEFYKKRVPPALQIHHSLDACATRSYQTWLIDALARDSLSRVAASTRVQKYFKQYVKGVKITLAKFGTAIQCIDDIGFIEDSSDEMGAAFASYYHFPKLLYVVRIIRYNDGRYGLHVGDNPWNKRETKKHIGNFLRRHFGGGGHAYVGGAYFASKQNALNAAKMVFRYLNNK